MLRIASEIDFPKVRTFLESVARGSINSKGSYEIGLKHLQCFLSSNNNNNGNDYQHQNYYNVETIVLALQSNTINKFYSNAGALAYVDSSEELYKMLEEIKSMQFVNDVQFVEIVIVDNRPANFFKV